MIQNIIYYIIYWNHQEAVWDSEEFKQDQIDRQILGACKFASCLHRQTTNGRPKLRLLFRLLLVTTCLNFIGSFK